MPSARPIEGSATFVIEASRTTTNWLAASRARRAPLRTSAVWVLTAVLLCRWWLSCGERPG